jgi:hypothetical protein
MTPQEQHDIQLRLNCLSLAAQTYHLQPDRVLNEAKNFYNYALGIEDAEIIYELKDEDFKNNPTLKKEGFVVGDIIGIPQES